jgi:hypothetical protein
MVRLILVASVALVLAAAAGQAQQGAPRNPPNFERCKQLATERGFSMAGERTICLQNLERCKQLANERGFLSAGGWAKGQGSARKRS